MNENKSLALVGLFSALIVLARLLKFLAIHVPGFGGFGWLLILLIGRLIIPRKLAATELLTISSIIMALAGLDMPPHISIPAYVVTGLVIDCCYKIACSLGGRKVGIFMGGILGNISHIAVKFSILSLLGFKVKAMIVWGLSVVLALHAFFGLLAGAVAIAVVMVGIKVRVPQYRS